MSEGPASRSQDGLIGNLDTPTILLVISLVIAVPILILVSTSFPSLTFVVVVIMVTMFLVYFGSMVKARLRGTMVNPIIESLYLVGPTVSVFIILAMKPSQFPEDLENLALPTLLLGATVAANPVAKTRPFQVPMVVRALILVFTGILLLVVMGLMGKEDWGTAFLLGLAVAGAVSLLGLFREHSNPLLRDVGASLDRQINTGLLALLAVGVSSYFLCVRPSLSSSDLTIVSALEWAAVALAVLALALWARKRLAFHQAEDSVFAFRDIGAVMAEPALASSDLAAATEAVKAFVDRGEKDRVIVLMVSALKANGLSDGEITDLIRGLIGYREEEISLAWARTYGDVQAQRRKDRIMLLSKVLKGASLKAGRRGAVNGRTR